jgi:predicted transcriptional regulator
MTKKKKAPTEHETLVAELKRVQRERNELRTEVRDLHEIVDEFDDRLRHHSKLAVKTAIEDDMQKRVKRVVMLSMKNGAKKMREEAENEAREYIVETGDKENFPSGIIVGLRSADVLKQMAEDYGGVKFDFQVQ